MFLRFLHLFRNESLALVTVTRYNTLHNAFFRTLVGGYWVRGRKGMMLQEFFCYDPFSGSH